jgi:hypothetical protein
MRYLFLVGDFLAYNLVFTLFADHFFNYAICGFGVMDAPELSKK